MNTAAAKQLFRLQRAVNSQARALAKQGRILRAGKVGLHAEDFNDDPGLAMILGYDPVKIRKQPFNTQIPIDWSFMEESESILKER